MENYADYEFYKMKYKGSLSIDLFSSLIVKASREIDKNVNRELTPEFINKLSSRDQYKIKYTACELCDYFNINGSNGGVGKAKNISIDGVSISRANSYETKDDASKKKRSIIDNLPHEIIRYL